MHAKRQIILMLILLLIYPTLLTGCASEKVATRSDFVLDTVVTITLYGTDNSDLLTAPFEKIRELNDKFDAFSENSEIAQINAAAGKEKVTVSQETFDLIALGIEYGEKTQGALDITIGPLVTLWNIGEKRTGTVPSAEDIESARQKVDYRKVQLDKENRTVYLEEEGMALNLGAVAKGYIGDRVKEMLTEEGVTSAIINLGGNVVLLGGHTKRQPFQVGIENPLDTSSENIGVLSVRDCSIVTSGDYERYFTDASGKRYHHIIDPATGYPADTGLHQVTVIDDQSARADALSTACFVLGKDRAEALLKDLGVDAVFVTTDNQIIVTEGAADKFTFNSTAENAMYEVEQ